ncbi:hypothetical protein [Novosphingobium sp.]|uniref:hypothetical protein n=1 Tax=Novosphingobium sp. TaxID=1874826 RepID=UPI003D0EFB99
MTGSGPKPMASLGSSLLGRRAGGRRVPLSFAPIEADVPDAAIPEVLRQIERLTVALGIGTHEPQPGAKQRIACTVRLDATRHARMREIANARATSAQRVLVDALDHYLDATSTPSTLATPSSRAPRSTGNQP